MTAMLIAHRVITRGAGPTVPATDHVVLELEDRRRRRLAMRTQAGTGFLLDLADVPALRDGDGLELSDGRIVGVVAAPEPLLEITAADLRQLVRIAWHLGNRHLPTQLLGERLRIRADHVIADMVRRLGGAVVPVIAPFDPEGGAYGHGPVHAHEHVHSVAFGQPQRHDTTLRRIKERNDGGGHAD